MKYFLYIIYSPAYNKHYIGISDAPKRRLVEHNSCKVKSTKAYIPYNLVWTEEYADKTTARKRELFLKRTAKERQRIYQIIHGAIV